MVRAGYTAVPLSIEFRHAFTIQALIRMVIYILAPFFFSLSTHIEFDYFPSGNILMKDVTRK